MIKKRIVCYLFLLMFVLSVDVCSTECSTSSFLHAAMREWGRLSRDIIQLHVNLFSSDSACVFTAGIPFFISSCFLDRSVHSLFYDEGYHVNKRQISSVASRTIEEAAFGGIVVLSTFSLYVLNPELRLVSRLFALGAISGLLVKRALKGIHSKECIRPLHEKFDKNITYYSGFPSGHMFEAAYMATVFGAHYGLKALLPLGAFAGAMFAVSINNNRHYLSQVVAGTGLGVIYGLAVHSLIDRRLSERFRCKFASNQGFGVGCGIEVSF